jgi:hypothetical protein
MIYIQHTLGVGYSSSSTFLGTDFPLLATGFFAFSFSASTRMPDLAPTGGTHGAASGGGWTRLILAQTLSSAME